MIQGFEQYTHELKNEELPVFRSFVYHLAKHVGASQAVSGAKMAKGLSRVFPSWKDKGGSRIRKYAHIARVNNLIPRLVASSNGYYVCKDDEELKQYIRSLFARSKSIEEIAFSLMRENNITKEQIAKN